MPNALNNYSNALSGYGASMEIPTDERWRQQGAQDLYDYAGRVASGDIAMEGLGNYANALQAGISDQPLTEEQQMSLMDLTGFGGITKGVKKLLPKQAVDDYGMAHRPSGRETGASLDDLSNIYPDDIYSAQGAQYYGHYGQNNPMDFESVGIINKFRGNPNRTVTIYRAVPYEKTNVEQLASVEKDMNAFQRRRKIPSSDTSGLTGSAWYDDAWDRRAALEEAIEKAGDAPIEKISINPEDWVTINRKYAKEHGEAQLGGKYKIVSKKVKASDIFTQGDSIHEWGYSPAGK